MNEIPNAATPNPYAMQTGSARHGSCSPQTHHGIYRAALRLELILFSLASKSASAALTSDGKKELPQPQIALKSGVPFQNTGH